MSRKGGYGILDLEGVTLLTTGIRVKIEGIYDRVDALYSVKKNVLISGLALTTPPGTIPEISYVYNDCNATLTPTYDTATGEFSYYSLTLGLNRYIRVYPSDEISYSQLT